MNADRPMKMSSGWVHQTSGRMVWPNLRGAIAVVAASAISKSFAGCPRQRNDSVSDWFEAGEHRLRFWDCFERNAVADREELVPHREDSRIFVRLFDRLLRFPFRNFDDRAILRANDDRHAIGHEIFLAQSRNAPADQFEQFSFLSG